MIRIRYNDGTEALYVAEEFAKEDLFGIMIDSRGTVYPIMVSEVLESYDDGITVEKELFVSIKVEFT
jgi:hypothetical protein